MGSIPGDVKEVKVDLGPNPSMIHLSLKIIYPNEHLNSGRYQINTGRLTRRHDFSRIFSNKQSSLPLPASAKCQVLSQLHCTKAFPPVRTILCRHFGLSIPLYWTVRIEEDVDLVHGNVDLRLFVKTVEKDSSIDLSSIDSERIHSPCTWLNNTELQSPEIHSQRS